MMIETRVKEEHQLEPIPESFPVEPVPTEAEKPTTTVDALKLEIPYPSFQTTEILDFEPDQAQDPAQSTTTSDSDLIVTEEVKPKTKSRYFRFRYRRQGRVPKPLPTKPVAEDTLCPQLIELFTSYNAPFASTRRPYLQLKALETAALEVCPQKDSNEIREEFRMALKHDYQYLCRTMISSYLLSMNTLLKRMDR
jgi:hypothetical protein